MRKLSAKQLLQRKAITRQEAVVLGDLRKHGKACNRHLSTRTGLPINIITPRVFALRERGYVVQSGFKYDSGTNRTVRVWAA